MHDKMKINNFFKAYISPAYTWLASLCSIAGFVALFVNNKTACIIALSVFCICLLILLYTIFKGINRLILESWDNDYKSIATTFIYKAENERISTLDTFRTIQCKRLFLTEIHFKFKWTGSKIPTFSSCLQRIENVHHVDNDNQWDDAIVKFIRPLRYNECTVLNIKTTQDDFNNTAKPWLSCRLQSPLEIMQFCVMLPYKPNDFNEAAVFERKKIDSDVDGDFEYLESVEFNIQNKQYSFNKTNLEPGYIYRLRWKK